MRGVFVRPYVALAHVYLRHVKLPLSRLVDHFRPKSAWNLPAFSSLEEFAQWLPVHTRWRPDPLAGVLDVFPSLGQLAWQLEQQGVVEDDCDGLAFLAAQGARQCADSPEMVYVVTLVLDPCRLPLVQAAHVLCVFRHEGCWRVFSNGWLYPQCYPSFWMALTDNPHCYGHRILSVEVRDADLRPAPEPGR